MAASRGDGTSARSHPVDSRAFAENGAGVWIDEERRFTAEGDRHGREAVRSHDDVRRLPVGSGGDGSGDELRERQRRARGVGCIGAEIALRERDDLRVATSSTSAGSSSARLGPRERDDAI
jgi:hypothetical protein